MKKEFNASTKTTFSNWRDFQHCEQELEALLIDDALPSSLAALEQPFATFASRLLTSLSAIQKRLGGLRHSKLEAEMGQALLEHQAGDSDGHRRWIEALLVDCYDPMYSYQIDERKNASSFEKQGSHHRMAPSTV